MTYLSSKYVLSTHCILGTLLDGKDKAGNRTETPSFWCVFIFWDKHIELREKQKKRYWMFGFIPNHYCTPEVPSSKCKIQLLNRVVFKLCSLESYGVYGWKFGGGWRVLSRICKRPNQSSDSIKAVPKPFYTL